MTAKSSYLLRYRIYMRHPTGNVCSRLVLYHEPTGKCEIWELFSVNDNTTEKEAVCKTADAALNRAEAQAINGSPGGGLANVTCDAWMPDTAGHKGPHHEWRKARMDYALEQAAARVLLTDYNKLVGDGWLNLYTGAFHPEPIIAMAARAAIRTAAIEAQRGEGVIANSEAVVQIEKARSRFDDDDSAFAARRRKAKETPTAEPVQATNPAGYVEPAPLGEVRKREVPARVTLTLEEASRQGLVALTNPMSAKGGKFWIGFIKMHEGHFDVLIHFGANSEPGQIREIAHETSQVAAINVLRNRAEAKIRTGYKFIPENSGLDIKNAGGSLYAD